VGGIAPAWLTGARGFWFANTVSLMLAGAGLVLYLRRVGRAHAAASA
jgi:multidrug resistance protein, MATE family